MGKVRLIGGRVRKGKRKGNKSTVRWVTLTEIKKVTGLSVKDLRFILSECNLWSKKVPSRHAVEYRMARWNWMDKRYEWNKEETLKIIREYIQRGTQKGDLQEDPQSVSVDVFMG